MIIVIGYFVTIFALSLYSFALTDPNITFFQHPVWTDFRNNMVLLGYYHRSWSVGIFFTLLFLLFAFHLYFLKHTKRFKPFSIAIGVGILTLFSYPFLSHDFFNYMFDAKILTYYHMNPYLHRALDFPADPWIRFMHWTHRTYPYGPTFLGFTIIPSFFSFGKFLVDFLLFKGSFAALYLLTVWMLAKKNVKWALFFATSPLVLIEGLISSHNDLIAVVFALIGALLVVDKKNLWGRLLLIISAGIKYVTLPYIFISSKNKRLNILVFILILGLLGYLSFFYEVQPWYFLNLLIFIPFFYLVVSRLQIFFAGLLLSYYPYILMGEWNSGEKLMVKHAIIAGAFIINMIYLWYVYKREIMGCIHRLSK